MISVNAQLRPKLDPDFLPASLWNAAYLKVANAHAKCRPVRISVERAEGNRWIYDTQLAPDSPEHAADNLKYCERLIKFLLWAWGGSRVRIAGAPEIVTMLQLLYSKGNKRAFDADFMGPQCFGQQLSFEIAALDSLAASDADAGKSSSDSLKGNRIGFDLGGSDRKCAAVIDGEVVFSEEIKWNPYFESDPSYHRSGIEDSLRRAAAHLPHVDAIGGSAAGIYIDNEPRVGSLFRGIPADDFDRYIRPIFKELKQQWKNVPFEIANDGDVTAIAGAMTINENAVLGISMGTSQAVGYINPNGKVTGWLNELAFAPVDYRDEAPADEWSGDIGCGVQYFSQQAVGRLLPNSGIQVSTDAPLPEKLELVQEKILQGDERAAAIYETIGTYFGYSIAHYSDFYDFKNLLVLGRVSSGQGGAIILDQSRKVLELEFPELNDSIKFQTPDEKMKRHGQAVAAASLPSL
jgi:predicted NBD/HSP70 family sugar kinase